MEAKKAVIQATGLLPIVLDQKQKFMTVDVLDKRTVKLSLIRTMEDFWWYQLCLYTRHIEERTNTKVGGPFQNEVDSFELMLAAIKFDSENILPVGSACHPSLECQLLRIELEMQLESVVANVVTMNLQLIHQDGWIRHVATVVPAYRTSSLLPACTPERHQRKQSRSKRQLPA